jgi:phosphoenolpyruvate synthase/pyruvate phosphate dikinase
VAQGTIENPVINSPFVEPARHFTVVDGQVSGQTNDLVQHTLAADRTNPDLADLATALQPAVLRLIAGVVRAARANDRPVAVCVRPPPIRRSSRCSSASASTS